MATVSNTYNVIVRGRLQNDPAAAPDVTSAGASTAVLDALVVQGVEVNLTLLSAAEKATIAAAMKQAVVDSLD
jgi:hypothetical protein